MLITAALLLGGASVSADVMVSYSNGNDGKKIIVNHALISDMAKPRGQRPAPLVDTLIVKNNALLIPVDSRGNCTYMIPVSDRESIRFYTTPGDELMLKVNYLNPLVYSVEGSPLMNAISEIRVEEESILEKYNDAQLLKNEVAMNEAISSYTKFFKDYVVQNPTSPAIVYALLNLEGEDFLNAYNALAGKIENNPLYPLAQSQKDYVERSFAAEKKQQEMQSGHMTAPNFTLKNLEGKDVSLSDFKGKWVVIDFWGSWCGWCIKGFPQLKDAYEQYAPELEIIGVDCNESEEAWRRGVEKYKLPWVNVYNPQNSTLLMEYGVQGFPTKVIVNPEGKIANITVGENPSFFEILGRLIYSK